MTNENVGINSDGTSLDEVLVIPASYYNVNKMLSQNLLKSSKFLVRFLFGSLVEKIVSQENAREFTFLCDSVEFPGQSLTTLDYRMPGKLKLKIPYLRDSNEVTLTFYHNSKLPIYDVFTNWTRFISPTTTTNKYFDDILCDINILQFQDQASSSLELKRHMDVKLIGAFPLNFASMPSNWADDGFHKMSVTFFYEDIEINLYENNGINNDVNDAVASLDDFNTDEGLKG